MCVHTESLSPSLSPSHTHTFPVSHTALLLFSLQKWPKARSGIEPIVLGAVQIHRLKCWRVPQGDNIQTKYTTTHNVTCTDTHNVTDTLNVMHTQSFKHSHTEPQSRIPRRTVSHKQSHVPRCAHTDAHSKALSHIEPHKPSQSVTHSHTHSLT